MQSQNNDSHLSFFSGAMFRSSGWDNEDDMIELDWTIKNNICQNCFLQVNTMNIWVNNMT